tara:strand:+ start:1935 stop:2735 length:801 start_codon:yes stop_codon:yes gene_type:complete
MNYSGKLMKMVSDLDNHVKYSLPIGKESFNISDFIDNNIQIEFNNEIFCIKCNNKIKKSFAQGFCFPCFQSAPETSECILKPELCQAQEGIARDMEWARDHCLKDHFVYLSLTSGIKVGVTRSTQIPTRWIDQGAVSAIKFAKTPNRYFAGIIEVFLKQFISDRTAWQRMLKNQIDSSIDLIKKKNELIEKLPEKLKEYVIVNNLVVNINYPIKNFPDKVKSLSLDKNSLIDGQLTGIKGQYLYINNETVFNVRKHQGYLVNIKIN